jgi:hypothetical protein
MGTVSAGEYTLRRVMMGWLASYEEKGEQKGHLHFLLAF